MGTKTIIRWGAMWHSKNHLDGATRYIMFDNYNPALFKTKKEANEWIKLNYGYITKRKDMRKEPYGWRMPKPIKLKIILREIK